LQVLFFPFSAFSSSNLPDNKMKILYDIEIEQEFGQTSSQALGYASDLTRIYREARDSKRELAEANSQLRRYAIDLRKTISSQNMTSTFRAI
jgi:hypothetical protein